MCSEILCGFTLLFPGKDTEHLCVRLFTLHIICKTSLHIFAHVLSNWIVCIFTVEFWESYM